MYPLFEVLSIISKVSISSGSTKIAITEYGETSFLNLIEKVALSGEKAIAGLPIIMIRIKRAKADFFIIFFAICQRETSHEGLCPAKNLGHRYPYESEQSHSHLTKQSSKGDVRELVWKDSQFAPLVSQFR